MSEGPSADVRPQAPRIMLSYRRSDSAGITGRIFDRLAARFGADSVFMDIDSIPLGVDFRKFIGDAMKTMDHLLVVIGPGWSGLTPDGTTRLHDSEDPIRLEIELAFANQLSIVPVLVEGAKMPDPQSLPESLREVVFLNAATVESGPDFRTHIERLAESLIGIRRTQDRWGAFAAEFVVGNIPRRLSPLIGRADDVAAVEGLLEKSALVTIVGAGGIGKTRTAEQVAFNVQSAFVDGAWFVDLSALRTRDRVEYEIASALGVVPSTGRTALASILDHLRRRHSLLVLDNCEHLVGALADVIDAILSACPQTSILTTSREPLGMRGERSYRLPGLSVPSRDAALSCANAGDFSAISLFAERAGAANSHFSLAENNVAVVADICRALDGIALAIELAAAHADMLSAAEIRDRLSERFRVLADGRRTSVKRQQTMRATIDWSFDLLSDDERMLFRRLAIFAGGWTLDAVETTCAFCEEERAGVFESLSSLVRKSLVVADFSDDETRYKMLESTRAYATEKASLEWERLTENLCSWVAELTRRTDGGSAAGPLRSWLGILRREIDNIRFALESSLNSGLRILEGAGIAHRLAHSMFWYEIGCEGEGRRWVEIALERVDAAAEPVVAGRLWIALASLALGNEAVTAGKKAVEIFGRFGEPYDGAAACSALSFALYQIGEFEEAGSFATRALKLYESEGLERHSMYAEALAVSANIHRALGNDDEAQRAFAASLSIFSKNGVVRGAANAKGNLAEFEFERGNAAEALRLVNEAIVMFTEIGATSRQAMALVNASTYDLELGAVNDALASASEALRLARITSDTTVVSVALQNVAAVRALAGDCSSAARLIGYVDNWYRNEGLIRQWGEQRVADLVTSCLEKSNSRRELANTRVSGGLLTEDEAIFEALSLAD